MGGHYRDENDETKLKVEISFMRILCENYHILFTYIQTVYTQ